VDDEPNYHGRWRTRISVYTGRRDAARRIRRRHLSRSSTGGAPARRCGNLLSDLAPRGRDRRNQEETNLKVRYHRVKARRGSMTRFVMGIVTLSAVTALAAAEIKVDLSKETVGRAPVAFTP